MGGMGGSSKAVSCVENLDSEDPGEASLHSEEEDPKLLSDEPPLDLLNRPLEPGNARGSGLEAVPVTAGRPAGKRNG